MMSKTFREAAGDAIQGVCFPLWEAPRSEAYTTFLSSFKKRVGRAPLLEISTVPSYDIASLLVRGFSNGGLNPATGDVNTARLKEHLYAVHDYAGLSGPITIDPDGATRSLKVELFEVWGDSFHRVPRENAQ